MEFLHTNMLNATGVPSVIQNYVNEADYAKTLVMGNSKHMGRVVNYQLDTNPAMTQLYKNILKFSGVQIPEDVIDSLVYTLNPPKTLNTANMQDLITSAEGLVDTTLKAQLGENSNDEDTPIIKDIMFNMLIRDYLPSINWSRIDEIEKAAKMELQKRKQRAASNENNDQGGY
jgi:hypothetical protein